jgi:hypothetical protein
MAIINVPLELGIWIKFGMQLDREHATNFIWILFLDNNFKHSNNAKHRGCMSNKFNVHRMPLRSLFFPKIKYYYHHHYYFY